MIKPTIGRVVLVQRQGSTQRQPALVSYVHSDVMINVGGFDSSGSPFAETGLQLLQDEDAPLDSERFAEWMPYQKQVAVKGST